jgi:hypothetical protein
MTCLRCGKPDPASGNLCHPCRAESRRAELVRQAARPSSDPIHGPDKAAELREVVGRQATELAEMGERLAAVTAERDRLIEMWPEVVPLSGVPRAIMRPYEGRDAWIVDGMAPDGRARTREQAVRRAAGLASAVPPAAGPGGGADG